VSCVHRKRFPANLRTNLGTFGIDFGTVILRTEPYLYVLESHLTAIWGCESLISLCPGEGKIFGYKEGETA